MSKTWVVVAESSRAKIYEVDKIKSKKYLKELTGFSHSIIRNHKQKLAGNQQKESRHFQLTGSLSTHKDNERSSFARTIGEHLNSARNKGKFTKLILMSPPKFLGDLRKSLGNETNKHVISEVDKNLVRHKLKDIQAHMPIWY